MDLTGSGRPAMPVLSLHLHQGFSLGGFVPGLVTVRPFAGSPIWLYTADRVRVCS